MSIDQLNDLAVELTGGERSPWLSGSLLRKMRAGKGSETCEEVEA
jgi:hypothetical protein